MRLQKLGKAKQKKKKSVTSSRLETATFHLVTSSQPSVLPLVINSPHDCLLLQSDINSVSDWCIANSMRLNTAKTRVVSYTRKIHFLSCNYQLCRATITRTSSIKDLGVFFDSKLHFHNHVHYVFSDCIKLLSLIRFITYSFSALECLYVLYFTLVRPRLEYASPNKQTNSVDFSPQANYTD
jgi:hypothetical protein